ncbi:hypothetical protein HMPREF3053_09890 [Corynebacterium sp. HMSC064E07]|uniref:hypothetical protein n=1 Tax=Corynebacterium sp. HMSC064E07 TaxID=1739545 RepID=UPI0008A31A9D|nr:hypothetical protein [Corynebacterium sp. HMSC064E07]OFO26450.1 hypothetical protein HMPREF3053_09890 [Corynebacterium sp. HMSC064E07]
MENLAWKKNFTDLLREFEQNGTVEIPTHRFRRSDTVRYAGEAVGELLRLAVADYPGETAQVRVRDFEALMRRHSEVDTTGIRTEAIENPKHKAAREKRKHEHVEASRATEEMKAYCEKCGVTATRAESSAAIDYPEPGSAEMNTINSEEEFFEVTITHPEREDWVATVAVPGDDLEVVAEFWAMEKEPLVPDRAVWPLVQKLDEALAAAR